MEVKMRKRNKMGEERITQPLLPLFEGTPFLSRSCRNMENDEIPPMDMLPNEIISHNVSFLTVKDAARMAILARKHRFISSYLRGLDFHSSNEEFHCKCYDIFSIQKSRSCRNTENVEIPSMDMLPDEIISHIVSFLTVKDAARMNTLARKYRFISSSLRDLDFRSSNEEFHCKCYDIFSIQQRFFVKSVSQFLGNYFGPSIDRFSISFCLGREVIDDVQIWVRFAIMLGAEHLELNFSCLKFMNSSDVSNPVEYKLSNYLVFPGHLLPNSTESKLKHLTLQSCIFTLDSYQQFGSIITLSLRDVPLSKDDMKGVFASCLNLEYLNLIYCNLPDKLSVCGSVLRLKYLLVSYCFDLKKIELSATNLIVFEYAGDTLEFSFLDVPKLKRVHYRAECNMGLGYIFSRFGKDIPQLKGLSIYTESEWVTQMPKCLTVLRNLKRLDLTLNIDNPIIAKNVVAILEACPVLEKFNVTTICRVNQDANPNVELGRRVDSHLKEVVFSGFTGTTYEVALAMYLVENAVMLEKLVLDVQPQIYEGDYVWRRTCSNKFPDDERDRLLKILYERVASKKVVISVVGQRSSGETLSY